MQYEDKFAQRNHSVSFYMIGYVVKLHMAHGSSVFLGALPAHRLDCLYGWSISLHPDVSTLGVVW